MMKKALDFALFLKYSNFQKIIFINNVENRNYFLFWWNFIKGKRRYNKQGFQ